VKRVLLHAGKLHYDLLAEIEGRDDAGDFALVRLEQFYPLPLDGINAAVEKYPNAEIVWVQDEPENQGAWPFMLMELAPRLPLGRTISVVSRPASAATATGSSKRSAAEQTDLIARAFTL
jgi:2-oxoglutarate decarboxylase